LQYALANEDETGKEKTMSLPFNKTRIVCTIGPASDSPDVLKEMIRTGMDVARLHRVEIIDLEGPQKTSASSTKP